MRSPTPVTHPYEGDRPDVRELVPPGTRRVLDLGCAAGAVGAALKARGGVEVVGVEADRAYAEEARTRLDQVIETDVEQLAGSPELESLGRFDCLVAADVLEHLCDPWSALRAFAAVLEPGGHAVVSLPNVRFWETFWQLGVRRRWPRRDAGIFDRTHLRWFTRRDAEELLEQAGLGVVAVSPQYRTRRELTRFDPSVWRVLRHAPFRDLFTFQYVLLGAKPG
jgi:SAM-dependent methyltransferase